MAILDHRGNPLAAGETGRGASVRNRYEIFKLSGVTKEGKRKSVPIQMDWVGLDPYTALWLVQHCDILFGPITRRANRISSLPWQVVRKVRREDRMAEEMKMSKAEFFETQSLPKRVQIFIRVRKNLKNLRPDFSNFDSALSNWSKRIKHYHSASEEEIQDWFRKPANGVKSAHFLKQMVFDLMTHGCGCAEPVRLNGRPSLLALPGGTVVPVRGDRVGPADAYLQIWNQHLLPVSGTGEVPVLFMPDEIVFGYYMPNSSVSGGLTPLQALINTVASSLMTDEMIREYSDGNRDPEKVLIFGNEMRGPGDVANLDGHKTSISPEKAEQLKVELGQRKKTPITVLRGSGTPTVIDVSRENILNMLMSNLGTLREKVALCFNMSALEMAEGGSDAVSGRSTAEEMSGVDEGSGWGHLAEEVESLVTDAIERFWGEAYKFDFSRKQTESQRIEQAIQMASAQVFSPNEIRESAGKDARPDPKYDELMGSQSAGEAIDAGLQGLAALSKGANHD